MQVCDGRCKDPDASATVKPTQQNALYFFTVVYATSFLRIRALSTAGVAKRSRTKSHISYCVTAKSHIIHTGTHKRQTISSSLTHTFAQLDLL